MKSVGTVLVTGAFGPVGLEISSRLRELGFQVIGLDKALGEDSKTNHFFETLSCDLSNLGQLTATVSELTNRVPITHLVNNAAMTPEKNASGYNSPLSQQTWSAFLDAAKVNLIAPFELTKTLFYSQPLGTLKAVVNITSTYGKVGPNNSIYEGTSMSNSAAYAGTKGGLEQLTRYFATALAPHTRVNSVAPGGIARGQDQRFQIAYENLTPLRRMNTEWDVAQAVAFLLGDSSPYITGQSLGVDGGWTAW